VNVLDALRDPALLGGLPAFRDLSSWRAWIVFEKARTGLPLSPEELQLFRRHTERAEPRPGGYPVALAVTGRQCGKTRWLATGAAFAAATAQSAAGAFVTLVGQDLRGAQRAAFSYVREVFALPVFRGEVRRETQDTIELHSGVTLAVYPCRSAAVRGVRNLTAFMDEAAHFVSSEGRALDTEMYRALTPTLLTTGGRLVIATSPYAQTGLVWATHRKHWARTDSDVLVWQADSASMNPTLDASALQRVREDDPEGAESEVEGRFRRGLSALFDGEALDACVIPGRRELPPTQELRYSAFADPSGGRSDAFTVAVGHRIGARTVVDCVRAWRAPFNPGTVVQEACTLLASYSVRNVTGDRYGGEWPREAFRSHGLRYEVSAKDRSALYLDLLPAVNAGTVELPDVPDLLRELRGLERRRGSQGRDRVDHRAGSHDDIANAVAGLVSLLSGRDPADLGLTLDYHDGAIRERPCVVCYGRGTLGGYDAMGPLETPCPACSGPAA
jgi:hypothetical protein